MKIITLTLAVIITAFVISLYSNFALAVFYFVLAASVLVMTWSSKSWLHILLGFILFFRYLLENYEYEWSPIDILTTGHFIFAGITYLLVKDSPNRFLLYFPALMFCQGISDIMSSHGLPFYLHIHNVLAIMQMSAFLVLAWEMKRHVGQYDPVKELIENLLMTLARGWQLWKRKLIS